MALNLVTEESEVAKRRWLGEDFLDPSWLHLLKCFPVTSQGGLSSPFPIKSS